MCHITSLVRNHEDICTSTATRAAKDLLALKPPQPPSLLILPNDIRWLWRPFDTNRSAWRDMKVWKLAMRTATFVVGTEINAVPYILSISGNTHGCGSFDKSTTLPHFIRLLCFISSLCFSMFLLHGKSHGLLHVNWRLIGVQTMVFKKTVLLNAQVWHFLIPNKPLCLAYNWPCLQNVGTEIDSIGRACTLQILGNLAVAIVRFVKKIHTKMISGYQHPTLDKVTLGFWKVAQAKSIKHHWVSNGSRKEDSAPGKKWSNNSISVLQFHRA